MMARRSSTKNRRPQAAQMLPPAAADPGRHSGMSLPYNLLGTQEIDRLIESACLLLRDTGCGFEPGTEAIDLMRSAGCRVSDDGVVRFDVELVKDSLESCAKSVRLWNRAADAWLDLDADHTWFMPGMTCIKMFDPFTGELRNSTGRDLATIARVADALPNIDGVCVPCKDVPRSDIHGEINEFALLVHNTRKPLEYLCENAESFNVAIEMAAAVRGSRANLADRPYFLQIVTPLPLGYWRTHIDQVITGARAGVPISVGTLPIGGASSPITIAGCMVNSLATDFAGMVLGQLAERGSFVIGSSDVTFMEPATGGIGNFTHATLADALIHQVRRRLGIPSFTGYSGQGAARRFNQDAVWEISASMMQAFFSRPATLDYLGSLDDGISFSLHALCLCDELAGMLRAMWQGVPVNAQTLALDVAQDVGARGNYLAQTHTAQHCRDQRWRARYFGAHLPLSMSGKPDLDLIERIDADLQQILATHEVTAPDASLGTELARIQDRFRAHYHG